MTSSEIWDYFTTIDSDDGGKILPFNNYWVIENDIIKKKVILIDN